jgi:hypothetical protein
MLAEEEGMLSNGMVWLDEEIVMLSETKHPYDLRCTVGNRDSSLRSE